MPGNGPALFSLRTKIITFPHKRFYAESPEGKILFEVKGKFSSTHPTSHVPVPTLQNYLSFQCANKSGFGIVGSSKMIATFTNASNNQPVELLIKGDWFDRAATITMGNITVATISRNFMNVGQIFGNQQTYFLTCAPGVDYCLMAAICVCLDEKENEKK